MPRWDKNYAALTKYYGLSPHEINKMSFEQINLYIEFMNEQIRAEERAARRKR